MFNKNELNQEELKNVAGGGTPFHMSDDPIVDLPPKNNDQNLIQYIVLYTEIGETVTNIKDCKTKYLGMYATLFAAEQSGESWCKLNHKNYIGVRQGKSSQGE